MGGSSLHTADDVVVGMACLCGGVGVAQPDRPADDPEAAGGAGIRAVDLILSGIGCLFPADDRQTGSAAHLQRHGGHGGQSGLHFAEAAVNRAGSSAAHSTDGIIVRCAAGGGGVGIGQAGGAADDLVAARSAGSGAVDLVLGGKGNSRPADHRLVGAPVEIQSHSRRTENDGAFDRLGSAEFAAEIAVLCPHHIVVCLVHLGGGVRPGQTGGAADDLVAASRTGGGTIDLIGGGVLYRRPAQHRFAAAVCGQCHGGHTGNGGGLDGLCCTEETDVRAVDGAHLVVISSARCSGGVRVGQAGGAADDGEADIIGGAIDLVLGSAVHRIPADAGLIRAGIAGEGHDGSDQRGRGRAVIVIVDDGSLQRDVAAVDGDAVPLCL